MCGLPEATSMSELYPPVWWVTTRVRGSVDGRGTLLPTATVPVIPLLLVIAGDVETNPGPPKREGTCALTDTLT